MFVREYIWVWDFSIIIRVFLRFGLLIEVGFWLLCDEFWEVEIGKNVRSVLVMGFFFSLKLYVVW